MSDRPIDAHTALHRAASEVLNIFNAGEVDVPTVQVAQAIGRLRSALELPLTVATPVNDPFPVAALAAAADRAIAAGYAAVRKSLPRVSRMEAVNAAMDAYQKSWLRSDAPADLGPRRVQAMAAACEEYMLLREATEP